MCCPCPRLRWESLDITWPRTFFALLSQLVPILTPSCPDREIKAGLDYTCSSDLWSLGILILWMLDPSRVRPLQEAPTRANPTKSVRQELISNLYSVHMNCDGELGALVSQLLEEVSPGRAVWTGSGLLGFFAT